MAKYNTRKYIDEKLPYEYERCVIGLEIIKEAWDTATTEDRRTKIQALSLAKDAYRTLTIRSLIFAYQIGD
jgi:hypothetical protein